MTEVEKAGRRATRTAVVAALAAACVLLATGLASAQEERPQVGPFVIDVRPAFVRIPVTQELADSRGLTQTELSGFALGGVGGVHVYPLRWKAITFGIGGEVVFARAHSTPPPAQAGLNSVTSRFVSAAPQLSFNFRGSNGWSYISGGLGLSALQIVPDGQEVAAADEEHLRTVNYGAGARWFIKKHLGFSLDVRWWQMDPGTPQFGFPASPRTNMFVISAGIATR